MFLIHRTDRENKCKLIKKTLYIRGEVRNTYNSYRYKLNDIPITFTEVLFTFITRYEIAQVTANFLIYSKIFVRT